MSVHRGGAWSQGGACSLGVHGPGGYLVETPLTATAAGSTHPTGMHSFLKYFLELAWFEPFVFRCLYTDGVFSYF